MTKVWIRSIEATTGYLRSAGKITFAPGLNFVLGPKGTFKSTVVELLRIALGVDEQRIADLLEDDGRMTKALGGGAVRVEIEAPSGLVTATRSVDGGQRLSRKIPVDRVQVVSQDEIQKLAEGMQLKLDFVDRAHAVRKVALVEKRDLVATKLAAVGDRLAPVLAQVRQREEEVRAGASAAERLKELLADPSRPAAREDLEQEQKAFVEREALLGSVRELLDLRDEFLRVLRELCEKGRGFGSTGEALARYATQHGEKAEAVREAAEVFRKTADSLARTETWCEQQLPGEPLVERLARLFEEHSRPYHRLLAVSQQHEAFTKETSALRATVAKGERAKAELEGLKKSEAKLRKEREQLRAEIASIDAELRDLRAARVEKLKKVSPHTSVNYDPAAKSDQFVEALKVLLDGHLEKLREKVVANYSPTQLVDLVERQDVDALTGRLGARSNDAARFLNTLASSKQFHLRMEKVFQEDRVEITFRYGDTQKPVEFLSQGQRATALLPVLLQGDQIDILILDEPEAHLDNRFICDTLVRQLRDLRRDHQVIVVTHNANLVSLTDPDHVVIMDALGHEEAAKPLVGSFKLTKDEVVKIVEGGARAFREREQRYAIPRLEELDGRKADAGGAS